MAAPLDEITNNVSIVVCRFLSAKLFMYILVALLRASANVPAKEALPCLVNDDFSAPVPV
jgi:hypothetical protein